MHSFETIKDIVKSFLEKDSSGHDFHHAVRVFNNALHLHQEEGRGDVYVIAIAALMHDICRPWEKKTGKSHFSAEALEIIRGVMQDAAVDPDKIQPILDVIALHDIYDWSVKMDKSIELQIVQDADNLDAIGALGVARTFAFGGANGLTMYDPGESLEFHTDFVDDPAYRTTTIGHFYDKLLKLKHNMNTASGKKMAEARHYFMEVFLEQFFAEWQGKK